MLEMAEEDTKTVPKQRTKKSKATELRSDLVEAQQKLVEMQKDAKKTQSQLKSQIEILQKKNNSLVSELEQAISDVKELTASASGTPEAPGKNVDSANPVRFLSYQL